MELITTHLNADFDALASLVAAKKLHPASELCLPGSTEYNVGKFLQAYPDLISVKKVRQIKLDEISKLVIVDTQGFSRIGKFKKLLAKSIPIYIYDHHPPFKETGRICSCEVGATVTLLLKEIRKRKISITPMEATLFGLGIYEDTGSLTFPTTTARDIETVSFLLGQGADLSFISKFLIQELNPEQVSLLNSLLCDQRRYLLGEKKLAIALAQTRRYVRDLAVIAHQIMDMEGLDALFLAVKMQQRIYVVARSREREIDVGGALSKIGGGGHPSAASAVIRDLDLEEVKEKICSFLGLGLKDEEIMPTSNLATLMEERLPFGIQTLLKRIGQAADELGCAAYVAGGFVRDLLLGASNFDIDIVAEPDGISFAHALAKRVGGQVVKSHERFKTAVIKFPDGFKLDIATARLESYEHPAALPKVEKAPLKWDLHRRDFTINAMAIWLNSRNYGDLIDFFSGCQHLKKGIIRILHKKSFFDDPTRIFRAVRFEARYNFKIDPYTVTLIQKAISNKDLFKRLGNQRVRDEMILILSEDLPLKPLERLFELGLLNFIHPEIKLNKELFRLILDTFFNFELLIGQEKMERWLVFFLGMADELSLQETEELASRLKFNRRQEEKSLAAKKNSEKVISELLREELEPGKIYETLKGVHLETLIYCLAKASLLEERGGEMVKRRVANYLAKLRQVKIETTGEDLKRLGLPPGPLYRKILKELLYGRLEGVIKTKEEEERYILDNYGKKC